MKKIFAQLVLFGIVGLVQSANADNNYASFQQFNRQFNLNFGSRFTSLKNGAGEVAGVTTQTYGLNVERLFDNGVWFDVDGNIASSSLTNQTNGVGSGQSAFNQDPNLGGLNAKVGYSFIGVADHLLLTPYGLLGRNTNLSASTLVNNNNSNISNNFYYTAGLGGRLQYLVNDTFSFYLDQLVGYNWDQSGPVNGIMPQNNMVYTTTLGGKFNVYKQLQIGLNGFYSFYQNMASLPQDTTGTSVYSPCNCGSYGGTISVGMTY
jgi:hypothetical protein